MGAVREILPPKKKLHKWVQEPDYIGLEKRQQQFSQNF